MSLDEGIRKTWQSAADAPPLPAIEAVRRDADALHRLVRRRNAIEYGAALAVVLVFSAYALLLPSETARIGSALVVLGTLVMVWQLRRRASALPPPELDGVRPVLLHQRAQLARQRDALASVFLWYLLPLLPGLAVMKFGPTVSNILSGLRATGWGDWVSDAVIALVFVLVWGLNRRAASRLDRHIADLDRLLGEGR